VAPSTMRLPITMRLLMAILPSNAPTQHNAPSCYNAPNIVDHSTMRLGDYTTSCRAPKLHAPSHHRTTFETVKFPKIIFIGSACGLHSNSNISAIQFQLILLLAETIYGLHYHACEQPLKRVFLQ
jgi:hypothetical protein